MYVVSCRTGFESNVRVSKEIAARNYKNPLDPTKFDEMTMTELKEAARGKHVAILVHGFNNKMTDVMSAYWEIVSRMNETEVFGAKGYGLVIGFTWPGMAIGPLYIAAVKTAKSSAPRLLELLTELAPVAHSVDVQTHSLGARVALTALKDPKKIFIDNLLLSAPAVDNHLLEPDESFFNSTQSCNRCIVLHSRKDAVLGSAYWVGDLTDGIHAALGLKGTRNKTITLAKTPNVYVVDCTSKVGTDHGGYRKTASYFKYWNTVLTGGPLARYDEI